MFYVKTEVIIKKRMKEYIEEVAGGWKKERGSLGKISDSLELLLKILSDGAAAPFGCSARNSPKLHSFLHPSLQMFHNYSKHVMAQKKNSVRIWKPFRKHIYKVSKTQYITNPNLAGLHITWMVVVFRFY